VSLLVWIAIGLDGVWQLLDGLEGPDIFVGWIGMEGVVDPSIPTTVGVKECFMECYTRMLENLQYLKLYLYFVIAGRQSFHQSHY
jgi:hypothetical protein